MRKAWVGERVEARLAKLQEADSMDPHDKAGHHSRAAIFSKWLEETYGAEVLRAGGVMDVAGGRGDVSFELHTKRNIPCTLIEPRARKLNRGQHKYCKARIKLQS